MSAPSRPSPPLDLNLACPSCAVLVAPDSRFCHDCGVPLVELTGDGTPAVGGERRPITVLFIDALSATGDLGRLDPEEVHSLVERLLAVIGEGIERFDGTIDRFTGHGVKALFGAPTAQENHATLACHAALEVKRRLQILAEELRRSPGVELKPRMGIHSAEAVFGSIGHGPSGGDFLTQGHTAALASRIEQATEPGQIWLSAQTAGLVSDYFEIRDVGPVGFRGFESSQRIFALEGAGDHVSRFEAQRARGLSPFVGRSRELDRLEDAHARAQSAGPVRIALLGEAGIGKTRLCAEFARRCRSRGVAVYELRGIESSRWLSFSAAGAFLRDQLGIGARDGAAVARAKATERLLSLDPALRDSLPELLEILGVDEPDPSADAADPDARVALVGRVILTLFLSRTTLVPTVFILDDCRWLDPGTASLATLFFKWGRSGPFLFIASDRDEIDASWQEHAHFERLELGPLDDDSARTLVTGHLGRTPELVPLADRIQARAAGNPFFLEELIASVADRSLEDEGGPHATPRIDGDQLPATLHAVLSARVEALPSTARATLRAASVIDREFEEGLLADVIGVPAPDLEPTLDTLVEKAFLTRASSGGHSVYTFRHPLLREATYRFLLEETRLCLHHAVARSLIKRNPDALDEYAGLIAHHCEVADQPLEAARWHCRAGTFLGLRIPADARHHWKKALELTSRLPGDGEVAVLAMGACLRMLQLGCHLGMDPHDAAACFAAGRHHAERLRDDRTLALLIEVYGALRGLYGTANEAVRYAREASSIATHSTDLGARLALQSRLALSLFRAGDLIGAAEVVGDHPPALGATDPSVDLLGFSASLHLRVMRVNVLTEMGRTEGLREELLSIIASAEEDSETSILVWSWTSFAPLARAGGVAASEAARAAHRAIALVASGGNRMTRTPPLLALGIALSEDGRATEARDILQRALGSIRTGGPTAVLEAGILVALSRAVCRAGDPIRAERLAGEALALATARGARLYELDARLAHTGALLAGERTSRVGQIARDLDTADRLILETGAGRARADVARYRERLCELRGESRGPSGATL